MKTPTSSHSGHYIHQIRYNRRERMVGMFVFLALLIVAVLFFLSSQHQHFFEQHIRFYIKADSSEGLSQGSVVTLLGAEIGKVSSLKLTHEHKVHVTLDIYKSHQEFIRTDSKVIINRLVSLGNALIEIQPGSKTLPMLEEGATILVEETPSINDLVLGIAKIVQSADNGLLKKISEIMPRLEQTVTDAQKIIAQIATGEGTLGAAVFDLKVEQELKQVVQSGSQILTEADDIAKVARQRLVELEPVISSADQILNDVKGSTKNLPQTMTELQKTIAMTNTALTLLNDELQHLPGITLDARRTLMNVETVMEGTQNIWPLSTVIEKPQDRTLIPAHPMHD